jgi:hypothetical protein
VTKSAGDLFQCPLRIEGNKDISEFFFVVAFNDVGQRCGAKLQCNV